ncbi:hypothetical protein [Microbacterium sp. 179-I 3D4 NHS]|uniref:hypothetical protein n=1 Tax=Microbacterium sp. 179-I 3D4 NHS TaxID=3142381 RepID=UPI0039A1D220
MTPDPDDALSWEGDEHASPRDLGPRRREEDPRRARVGDAPRTPSGIVGSDAEADAARTPLSTAMLLITGVIGGVYLLYSIGWIVGGLRLQPLASFLVADAMFVPWFALAVAAPALWFLAGWVLTRGRASWIRVAVLLAGVVLLVPWPFVTVGVVGS